MRDYRHFLFFAEKATPEKVTLDQLETRHAVNVLRLTEKSRFLATDGRGTTYKCIHSGIINRELEGIVEEKWYSEQISPRIHLFTGIPERDPFESILVDCTALGAASISPLICVFSQNKWWENSWEKQLLRFQNKMIASMKQALSPWLPRLCNPVHFFDAIKNLTGTVIVADPIGRSIFVNRENIIEKDEITILVGPPGGFSPSEEEQLKEPHFIHVKIAGTRLRTELAATVLCSQALGILME